MEFIADLVDSLVWPATVVLLALIFRTKIATLLTRLRELSASGSSINAKFDEERDTLEAVIDDEIRTSTAEGRVQEAHEIDGDQLRRREVMALLEISPNSALATAQRQLEVAMRTVLKSHDFPPEAQARTIRHMAETLRHRGLLEDSEVKAIVALSRLRNAAVHGDEELGAERALLSIEVALHLVNKLERRFLR